MSSRTGLNNSLLPRRRNGKEQACEPCRKSKIACDHTLPVCSRCRKKKMAQKCVYMSAPMTRPLSESSPSENRRRSEPLTARTGTGGVQITFPLTPAHTNGSSAVVSPVLSVGEVQRGNVYNLGRERGVVVSSSSSRPPSDIPTNRRSLQPPSKPGGFFGPTSFSAVFAENRENLGGNDGIAIINDREPYIPSNESLQAQMYLLLAGNKGLGLGEPRTVLGARVLRMLPDQNTCGFLLERYCEKCNDFDSWSYKKSVMATATSLWQTFGEEFKEPRNIEDLERVSAIICKNATIPLEESDDFSTWIDSISGLNLRWEAVGGIYNALTSAILSLPERDAFFTIQRGLKTDRKHFAIEMKDCLQACITLSNYMDLLNILMLACCCRNMILQSVLSGDTSLVCWRQLGDLVSATTALGLHRQCHQRVTFLSEYKKYLFSIVFSIDKRASLLTGRPPALSYRYTKFELPLDLDDEVLIRGGDELQTAISRLDSNGWNTDGIIYISSKARGHGQLAIVLNEILELSLSDSADPSNTQINYLLARLKNTYTSFPSVLHLNTTDPSYASVPDSILWTRLCTRLHMLEHRLILERLSHKHGHSNGQSMIDCAREMLELTVLLWIQRDRFIERHCDYDWMLMCWGVPSSGVLCVELLKQMKQPPESSMLRLPRSEIVQNLSLLIGFLEWVRPSAGNYQLCKRMSVLVKRILDQILNPSPPSSSALSNPASSSPLYSTTNINNNLNTTSSALSSNSSDPTQPSTSNQDLPNPIFDPQFDLGNWEDGLDDLDWLNTLDWSRGPWRLDLGVGGGGQDFSAAARCY